MAPTHTRNNDLTAFPDGLGTYSKGIKHLAGGGVGAGIVDNASFVQFLKACGVNQTTPSADSANFEHADIKTNCVKFNGPLGAFADYLGGDRPYSFDDTVVDTPFDLDSKEYWVELVELYWASLLRDVPFEDYATNATAIAAANELEGFGGLYKGPKDPDTKEVSARVLFRGGLKTTTAGVTKNYFAGELDGPYLSQLCLHPASLGALAIDQKIKTFAPGMDFMTTFSNWQNVQSGLATSEVLVFDDVRRIMRTGRDTSAYTHSDELYQAYLIAYLVCTAVDITPENNKHTSYGNGAYKKQKPFATFGGPDISSVIGAVARAAIIAVWYQKWRIHLRHRPEYGGGLVHMWNSKILPPGIKKFQNIDVVLDSKALALSKLRFGSDLLSQAFPEGSPTHPAYPTGHGAVAGACITALKFFLDGTAELKNPVVPSCDGLRLEPYTGKCLYLNGELHKLAHNVSFGHGIHAGIHWRSDTDASLRLGEAVALSYLKQLPYAEKFGPITITKMDGEPELIAIKASVYDAASHAQSSAGA